MILWLSGCRYLLRHPWQLVFALLGVALGVAVVVAVDLANDSARRAFMQSAAALAGQATHQIIAGPGGLPEDLYQQLRVMEGIEPAAPLVEGYATVTGLPEEVLRLLGIDPFAEAAFRDYSPTVGGEADLARLLTEPGSGLLSAATAERLGVTAGGVLTLDVGGVRQSLTVLDLLPEGGAGGRLDQLLITDIATAQELLDRPGRLTRVDLRLPDDAAGVALLEHLQTLIPTGAAIVPAGLRGEGMAQMTRAFSFNLSALSLLALVVGMFLIYNTMSFSVLQRRGMLGMLRAQGVTRREVFTLVLGEALLVGGVGTSLGLLLGVLLGQGLVGMVTRTINDLYFVLAVQGVTLRPLNLIKWLSLGLGATVLSALIPAREAATVTPRLAMTRSQLEHGRRQLAPRAALAGLAVLLLGVLLALGGERSLTAGFALLFALLAAFALATPYLTLLAARLLQPVMASFFGLLGRMAARSIGASLSRTGVATAALVIALSATIGVAVMIGSFRQTVSHWLDSYLTADLYITAPGPGRGEARPPLPAQTVELLSSAPEAQALSRLRHVRLETGGEPLELLAVDLPGVAQDGYEFLGGDPQAIWAAFAAGALIISEPFAWHHQLQAGDRLPLRTDRGMADFPIAGIFRDYGSDRGRVTMDGAVYRQWWDDARIDGLGLYLHEGFDPEMTAAALRARTSATGEVQIYANSGLRASSLAVFDRTFAITAVLRLLAVAVAFVGILNALMAMQVERSRELAVLRAIGVTPAQAWLLVTGETSLLGTIAGLLAIPLGLAQALVLIHVVNRRAFGWTMEVWIDPLVLLQALGLAIGAALLAGILPAWRLARTSPALALREE
jgi:putative ABC transport system permease protein